MLPGNNHLHADKIIEVLKLPRGVVPVTTVTLGWPAEIPDQPDRLPPEAVVHKEVYTDYSDKEIERFYSEKERREDSRQFVRENNKSTLAQVFTDVRYKKEDNIYFSKILLKVLEDQGFMNHDRMVMQLCGHCRSCRSCNYAIMRSYLQMWKRL